MDMDTLTYKELVQLMETSYKMSNRTTGAVRKIYLDLYDQAHEGIFKVKANRVTA